MSTRGASEWVRKTPTGLPDWTSRVSSASSSRSAATIASYDSRFRAALPIPPYTTRSSGRSATSGSRLFISIRSGASVSQLFADRTGPVGALTVGVRTVCITSPSSEMAAEGGQGGGEVLARLGAVHVFAAHHSPFAVDHDSLDRQPIARE